MSRSKSVIAALFISARMVSVLLLSRVPFFSVASAFFSVRVALFLGGA